MAGAMNKVERDQHRRRMKHPHTRVRMTEIDLAKLSNLAHKLIGVTFDTELNDELAALTIEEGRALDAMAFECVGCEMWFAAHERKTVKDKWYCGDCAKDET
jgi:hypothetical protein